MQTGRIILFVTLGWFGYGLKASGASAEASLGDRLVAKATELHLEDAVAWRRLLFMVPGFFSSQRSLVDSPSFFLAPGGKTDARAELEATLRALVDPNARVKSEIDGAATHPQCAFPARMAYLDEQLRFKELAKDLGGFPRYPCPQLEEWLEGRKYRAVSVIFSSYYPDNPASMFGHSFLRLHRDRGPGVQTSDLLDDAVNFSAYPTTANPLTYSIMGVLGGFPGRFSLLPYYAKIQEYNNLESRDLWEYELTLDQEATQRLTLVLWELGPVHIDYFYFDENCSFIILALLEAADERLELTAQVPFYAIPLDCVRAILRTPGLKRTVRFRASAAARYRDRYGKLNEGERAQMEDVLQPGADLSKARSKVLDAALERIDYEEKLGGSQHAVKYAAQRNAILQARARLPEKAEPLSGAPERDDPERAHETSHVGLVGGRYGSEPSLTLDWEPALHDLLAADEGYAPGMQIDFLPTGISYVPAHDGEKSELYVRDVHFVRIISANPVGAGLWPRTWTFDLGVDARGECERESENNPKRRCHRKYIRYGQGLTGQWGGLTAFGMAVAELGGSNEEQQSFYAGAGPLVGVRWAPVQQARVVLSASIMRRVGLLPDDAERIVNKPQLSAEAAWTFAPRWELRAKVARYETLHEVQAGLHWYY